MTFKKNVASKVTSIGSSMTWNKANGILVIRKLMVKEVVAMIRFYNQKTAHRVPSMSIHPHGLFLACKLGCLVTVFPLQEDNPLKCPEKILTMLVTIKNKPNNTKYRRS